MVPAAPQCHTRGPDLGVDGVLGVSLHPSCAPRGWRGLAPSPTSQTPPRLSPAPACASVAPCRPAHGTRGRPCLLSEMPGHCWARGLSRSVHRAGGKWSGVPTRLTLARGETKSGSRGWCCQQPTRHAEAVWRMAGAGSPPMGSGIIMARRSRRVRSSPRGIRW